MAAEKIGALVEAGAIVRVVSPELRDDVRTQAHEVVERGFSASDLDDAWYVVAAAPPNVNRDVSKAAAERRVFVNAVDDLDAADAYLGSIIRRSGMTMAISSNAAAPALTALIRRGLERMLPEDLDAWVELARDIRAKWKAEGLPFEARRPALLRALNELYPPEEVRP